MESNTSICIPLDGLHWNVCSYTLPFIRCLVDLVYGLISQNHTIQENILRHKTPGTCVIVVPSEKKFMRFEDRQNELILHASTLVIVFIFTLFTRKKCRYFRNAFLVVEPRRKFSHNGDLTGTIFNNDGVSIGHSQPRQTRNQLV